MLTSKIIENPQVGQGFLTHTVLCANGGKIETRKIAWISIIRRCNYYFNTFCLNCKIRSTRKYFRSYLKCWWCDYVSFAECQTFQF